MRPACRHGDLLSTGHSCVATTVLDTPRQNTVFFNGRRAARHGDPTVGHPAPPIPPCPNHVRYVNAGSPNVFVEGAPLARVRDSADSGQMLRGSSNIFAN
jgi:uncharacterized Zn-binding protein involved in type VI secretion